MNRPKPKKTIRNLIAEEEQRQNQPEVAQPTPILRVSNEQFEEIIDETFKTVLHISATKGREYSGSVDRLRNFRQTADEIGILPETVIRTFMKKHWDSIGTYISDRQQGYTTGFYSESIEGRIDDLIVYALLLKARIQEINKVQHSDLMNCAVKAD